VPKSGRDRLFGHLCSTLTRHGSDI